MLTVGEAITSAYKFYQNAGSDLIYSDSDLREKALFFLRMRAKRAYTLAPYWWKHGDGTVTITNGVGTLPADFATFGTEGGVFVQNQPWPLAYLPPDDLKAMLQGNAQVVSVPSHYTLDGKTAAGLLKIKTYPLANCVLDLKAYDKRCPDLVDFPIPPVSAAGAAGLLDGTGYTWRVTFVHPLGETEGGTVSTPSLALALLKGELTSIPVSPVHAVTARNIYRNASAGIQHKLVGTISDNLTTTFSDNVADGSLGANVPTAASGAISGLELFPEDFHEEIFVKGIATDFARPQGDVREVTFGKEWELAVKAMWANQKQGQNQPKGMPRFGSGRSVSRRPRLLV